MKQRTQTISSSEVDSYEMDEIHPIGEPHTEGTAMSETGLARRRGRTMYSRGISKKNLVNFLPSRSDRVNFLNSGDVVDASTISSGSSIEYQAEQIARLLEQDKTLMEDKPKSEKDRLETLRVMPESLTLKRSVKMKLSKTVDKKSKKKPISFVKRSKYRFSIFFSKLAMDFRNFLYSFELWYSSLKTIEGHFGSGVATYFKFLRRLFILNIFIFLVSLAFIVTPQLLYQFLQVVDDDHPGTSAPARNISGSFPLDHRVNSLPLIMMKDNPYEGNDEFRFGNIFTGEGFLADTVLFYGYYTNVSLSLTENFNYHIPTAYFLTAIFCYGIVFLILSVSMAISYRKSVIETSGGMKNVFAHKVFSGWDFGIATKQAADLKSRSIHMELKELLDEQRRGKKKRSCLNLLYLIGMQFSMNALITMVVGAVGWYTWKVLDKHIDDMDTATTMMMSLTLTVIIILGPMFFSWVVRFEEYDSPRSALYVTLVRTSILDAAVMIFVVSLRLHRSSERECWETTLGQEVYRLVLLDFLFGLVGTALAELIRYRIFTQMWPKIGCPEFDIARNTMNLIYNQTLFYIGLYFSPVLSFVIILKMFITFYIKKWGAIYNCKPSSKPWRAAQTHTVFLTIAFVAFFIVIVTYGYILTSVHTSNCGPFRGNNIMYEEALSKILPEDSHSIVIDIIRYAFRPGVIAVVLIAMGLGVYYLRSIAEARKQVVILLRDILLFQAKDKEFLLQKIAQALKRNESDENPDGHEGDGHPRPETSTSLYNNTKLSVEQKRYEEILNLGKTGRNSSIGDINYRSKFDGSNHLNTPVHAGGSKMFKSTQNINHYDGDTASNNRRYHSVHNIFDSSDSRSHASTSRLIENFDGYSSDRNEAYHNGSTFEAFEVDLEPKTNFNPVFTESLPVDDCSDEEVDRDGRQILNLSRLHGDYSQSKKYTPHHYDDRVPSRIGFYTSDSRTPKH